MLYSMASLAMAAGGPLGIDHRWNYDNSGIWKRNVQTTLVNGLIVADVAAALWNGSDDRFGKTSWYALDSLAVAGASTEILKHVFQRERPIYTDDPDRWFQGSGNVSFPSGDVTAVTSIITPFVLEYRHDHPAVYLLELLPLYDGIARMKVQAHWQTDVLAGYAIGTAAGYFMHSRKIPLTVQLLPHGLTVGLSTRF